MSAPTSDEARNMAATSRSRAAEWDETRAVRAANVHRLALLGGPAAGIRMAMGFLVLAEQAVRFYAGQAAAYTRLAYAE